MLEPGEKLNNSWSKLYALYAKLWSLISDVKASPLFSVVFVLGRALISAGCQDAHHRTTMILVHYALVAQRGLLAMVVRLG